MFKNLFKVDDFIYSLVKEVCFLGRIKNVKFCTAGWLHNIYSRHLHPASPQEMLLSLDKKALFSLSHVNYLHMWRSINEY